MKVVFRSWTRLTNVFRFKDKISLCLCSNIIYKFACGRCNTTCYDKSCRYFNLRVCEHSGTSPLTNKPAKSKKLIAVKGHMLMCDQLVCFDDFKVLASSNFEFYLKIKESLLISRDQPILNKIWSIFPILFVWLVTQVFYSLIWLVSFITLYCFQ